jgi:hypothetical protein
MSDTTSKFELARNIEHYLAALSKLYKRDQKTESLDVLVNAQITVHEQWDYDNWDGGTYGHALSLSLPDDVYLGLIEDRDSLQNSIRSDLNKLHNIPNEHISQVFIEMQTSEDRDWRQESGMLHIARRTVVPDAVKRIWGDSGYRVFLSHKSEVKKETAGLSEGLRVFGIAAFVAHENIHPTKEWQNEIENALFSMDAFVALLTKEFHESNWTDQEVGFALGRGVPVICVKLGRDPYGFIGKFQALSCNWTNAPGALAKLLIRQPGMLDAYIAALPRCRSFEDGILLSKVFPEIERLTPGQADTMMAAFNANPHLRGSWGFNGAYPRRYGDGLAPFLSRATGLNHALATSGDIERKKK